MRKALLFLVAIGAVGALVGAETGWRYTGGPEGGLIDTVVVEWGYGADDFTGVGASQPSASVATMRELREALGVPDA